MGGSHTVVPRSATSPRGQCEVVVEEMTVVVRTHEQLTYAMNVLHYMFSSKYSQVLQWLIEARVRVIVLGVHVVTSSQKFHRQLLLLRVHECCDTSDCVQGEAGALSLFECVPSVILVTVFGVRQEPYHCSSKH